MYPEEANFQTQLEEFSVFFSGLFDNQWRKGDHQEAARVLELQLSLKALLSTRVISLVVVGN